MSKTTTNENLVNNSNQQQNENVKQLVEISWEESGTMILNMNKSSSKQLYDKWKRGELTQLDVHKPNNELIELKNMGLEMENDYNVISTNESPNFKVTKINNEFDNPDGFFKDYHSFGFSGQVEKTYKNGLRHGVWKYFESGDLEFIRVFKNGVMKGSLHKKDVGELTKQKIEHFIQIFN